MRVLEPHYFKQAGHKRKPSHRKRNVALGTIFWLGVLSFGYVLFGQDVRAPGQNEQASQAQPAPAPPAAPVLKQFTAEQFKKLYSSLVYPNTQPIASPPTITGNDAADERIRKIAEARGYKLTALPVASIVKTGEPGLEGDDLIQPNALIAWQKLKAAAAKDNITLKLTSAYRSIEYQRTLFSRRLQNVGVHVGRILEGFADDELDSVLARAAPPGYSRHHTGYVIDLSCNGVGLEAFKGTNCYAWLSKNNFEHVKKVGLVPSYPEGAGDLGPEPEPWEFVWVGSTALYE